MTGCTGPTGFTTAVDIDLDVESFDMVGQHQGCLAIMIDVSRPK